MFSNKAQESMRTTINYLQDENKELKKELKNNKFDKEEYENLKNRHERVLNILSNIKNLVTQNTYGKPEVTLRKIKELSLDGNLIR